MRPYPRTLALLVSGLLVLRRLTRVEVTGDSMRPLLAPGDRLLVWRTKRLRTGDLTVVRDPRAPQRWLVKRVHAVVGKTVDVRGDAPAVSTDSRTFGPVALAGVVGRPIYRYVRGEATVRPNAGRTGRLPPRRARGQR